MSNDGSDAMMGSFECHGRGCQGRRDFINELRKAAARSQRPSRRFPATSPTPQTLSLASRPPAPAGSSSSASASSGICELESTVIVLNMTTVELPRTFAGRKIDRVLTTADRLYIHHRTVM